MAPEHDFISRLVDPRLAPARVRWDDVRMAMGKVTAARSAESETVLRKVLKFNGEITVRQGSDHPHMFTPREWLQAQAIQALAAWGAEVPTLRGALAAVKAFADATESDALERLARSYLGRHQGAAKFKASRRRAR